jgi:hypothetical protein
MPALSFGPDEPFSGMIGYWNDDPANLPAGWVVCDGNNGTPNLLDEFGRGVPDSGTDPGATGGQHSYTLSTTQIPAHDHYVSGSDSGGSHNHSVYAAENIDGDPVDDEHGDPDGNDLGNGTKNKNVNDAGSHSHQLDIGTVGSDASIDNRPAFVELVPVMKT